MKNFTRHALFFLCFIISLNKSFAKENNTPVAESIRSNLYLLNPDNSTVLADGNLAQYNNSYNAGIDFLDVAKFGNINETFSITRDNMLFAIERRPIIAIADTLFFNLTKTTQRNYQFQFTTALLNHPGLTGTLEDSYTGSNTAINLNGTTVVNFSIDSNLASQNPNRFRVVFAPPSVTPVHFSSITALQQEHTAEILWSVENELNIKQYNIERSTDGSKFNHIATMSTTGNSSASKKYDWVDITATTGNYFYRVCSVGNDGALLYSQVVKVKIGTVSQTVAIYPNPAHNGVIGLQLDDMPQGIYTIRLINASGQQVSKTTIDNSETHTRQNISINKNSNKGVYQLEVVAPDNSRKFLKVLYY